MKYLLEVLKIIRFGAAGNKQLLTMYAEQLAVKLERSGDEIAAGRVRRALDGSSPLLVLNEQGDCEEDGR